MRICAVPVSPTLSSLCESSRRPPPLTSTASPSAALPSVVLTVTEQRKRRRLKRRVALGSSGKSGRETSGISLIFELACPLDAAIVPLDREPVLAVTLGRSPGPYLEYRRIPRGELPRGGRLRQGVDERFDRLGALVQGCLLLGRQLDLDDLFQAFRAELARHPDEQVPQAVLPLKIDRTWQHFVSVVQNGVGHLGDGPSRRVVGASCLEEVDDLGAAVGGALDQPLDGCRVEQLGDRDARDGRIARQRD